MDHERFSRRLNAWLGGDPTRLFCARARPPLSWLIDAFWLVRYGEAGHCRRIAQRERWRRLDDLDRIRWSGF